MEICSWDVEKNFTTVKSAYYMLPVVEKKVSSCDKFNVQWFSIRRQHALIVMADSLYYSRFRDYCKVKWISKCSCTVLN